MTDMTEYLSLEDMLKDVAPGHQVTIGVQRIQLRGRSASPRRWLIVSVKMNKLLRRWRLNITRDPNNPARLINILRTYIHQLTEAQVVEAIPQGVIAELEREGNNLPNFTTNALVRLAYSDESGAVTQHLAFVTPHEREILKLYH